MIKVKSTNGFINQLRYSLFFNYAIKKNILKNVLQYWTITNENNISFSKFFNDPCCLKLIENHMMCCDSSKEKYSNETFSFLTNRYMPGQNKELILKEAFKDFELKKEYKEKIKNFIKENEINNAIGVHLRTTCKTALLKINKKTRFQPKKIEDVLNKLKYNNNKIYLATDNKETQDKMINLFGDRILFYEKIKKGKEKFTEEYKKEKIIRNTSDLHTIFDFYVLKECCDFIGSNESTFSIMINYLRNGSKDKELLGSL